MQAPAWQTLPAAHALPHAPQFNAFVWRLASQPSVASMSQLAKPVLHVKEHVLAAQKFFAFAAEQMKFELVVPQPPQFEGSLFVSTQTSFEFASWHLVVPPTQSVTHAPAWHTLPDAHAVPQSPQFFGSFFVSTQTSSLPTLHCFRFAAHVVAHAPREHTLPAPHAVPQLPQCFESLCVSKHFSTPPTSHLVEPPTHSVTHAPAWQTLPDAHAVAQSPQ